MNDCRVVGKATLEGRLRLWWLANADIFDISTSKNDVFVDLIARRDRPVGGPILCAVGTNWKIKIEDYQEFSVYNNGKIEKSRVNSVVI